MTVACKYRVLAGYEDQCVQDAETRDSGHEEYLGRQFGYLCDAVHAVHSQGCVSQRAYGGRWQTGQLTDGKDVPRQSPHLES